MAMPARKIRTSSALAIAARQANISAPLPSAPKMNTGLRPTRSDEIAERTRTTKRMIYYYFGRKEQLYVALLQRAYATAREAEREVDVDHLEPSAAIRRLAELTFDHAEQMAQSERLTDLNTPAIELIARILERGRDEGVFRRDVDPVDLHAMISAFCVLRVANRHTFGALFGRDLTDPDRRETYRTMLGDMVVDYLRGAPA
jgi:AcrR family transcriptional regulator